MAPIFVPRWVVQASRFVPFRITLEKAFNHEVHEEKQQQGTG
jgi:hypothetical protein